MPQPQPQPQLCGNQAASATYSTTHGNTRSLTYWARPGIKPTTSWFLVGFINHCVTMGTPRWNFFMAGLNILFFIFGFQWLEPYGPHWNFLCLWFIHILECLCWHFSSDMDSSQVLFLQILLLNLSLLCRYSLGTCISPVFCFVHMLFKSF